MKDTIIKGNRASRSIIAASTLPEDWADARAQLIQQGWPIDLGLLNPAGVEQMGDPLNKETLLKDRTLDAIGLPHTGVPDEALYALALYASTGKKPVFVHVEDQEGTPIPGITVSSGGGTTDSNGDTIIYLTSSTSITFTSPYLDIANLSQSISPASGGVAKFVSVTMPVLSAGAIRRITSSGNYRLFKRDRSVDLCLGGGGNPGGNTSNSILAGYVGGDGGKILNVSSVALDKSNTYTASIGSGGVYSATTNGIGGNTTFAGYSSASGNKDNSPLNDDALKKEIGGKGGDGGYGGQSSAGSTSDGSSGNGTNTAGGGGGGGGGGGQYQSGASSPVYGRGGKGGTSKSGTNGSNGSNSYSGGSGSGGRGGNGGPSGGGGGGGGAGYTTAYSPGTHGSSGNGGPGIILVKFLD